MKNYQIKPVLWGLLPLLTLAGCDSIDTGGGISIAVILGIVVGIILLGWLALKVLGGVLELGFWSIVVIAILIIGFIAFIVIKSMGG